MQDRMAGKHFYYAGLTETKGFSQEENPKQKFKVTQSMGLESGLTMTTQPATKTTKVS